MSTPEQIAEWKEYDRVNIAAPLGIPWPMREKQIQVESGWDHYDSAGNVKSSPTGSKGLGQLNSHFYPEGWWKDPENNLYNSGKILYDYKAKYGSWRKALAAYNWGPGHVGGGVFDDGRGFGTQKHSPWDGTADWQCSAGHGVSAQCIRYLTEILGVGWKEPDDGASAPVPGDPPPTTSVPIPSSPFSVGPGVLEKMQQLGDKPATEEQYDGSGGGWSITYGESGRQYVYLRSTNRTHVFEPRNIAVVGANPSPGPTDLAVPWDSTQLIRDGFSTPAEWLAEFGVTRSIQAIVWHDMEGYLVGAIATWNTGVAGAHLCILRDGSVVRTVLLDNVAWHAGTSNTPGSPTYGRTPYWRANNINPFSVGIELEGYVSSGYTEEQIQACIRVGLYLKQTYNVPTVAAGQVIPGHHLHSELSSQRSDPGPLFPYARIISSIGS